MRGVWSTFEAHIRYYVLLVELGLHRPWVLGTARRSRCYSRCCSPCRRRCREAMIAGRTTPLPPARGARSASGDLGVQSDVSSGSAPPRRWPRGLRNGAASARLAHGTSPAYARSQSPRIGRARPITSDKYPAHVLNKNAELPDGNPNRNLNGRIAGGTALDCGSKRCACQNMPRVPHVVSTRGADACARASRDATCCAPHVPARPSI